VFSFTLTVWHLTDFGNFYARTTRLHLALHTRNSVSESSRELFKRSEDAASLQDCTWKKFFWLGGADFLWVTS